MVWEGSKTEMLKMECSDNEEDNDDDDEKSDEVIVRLTRKM